MGDGGMVCCDLGGGLSYVGTYYVCMYERFALFIQNRVS